MFFLNAFHILIQIVVDFYENQLGMEIIGFRTAKALLAFIFLFPFPLGLFTLPARASSTPDDTQSLYEIAQLCNSGANRGIWKANNQVLCIKGDLDDLDVKKFLFGERKYPSLRKLGGSPNQGKSLLQLDADILFYGAALEFGLSEQGILSKNFRFLVLDSNGGQGDKFSLLGFWLSGYQHDVIVSGNCLSACANYLLPTGRNIFLLDSAMVGWHGGAPTTNGEFAKSYFSQTENITQEEKQAILEIISDFHDFESLLISLPGARISYYNYRVALMALSQHRLNLINLESLIQVKGLLLEDVYEYLIYDPKRNVFFSPTLLYLNETFGMNITRIGEATKVRQFCTEKKNLYWVSNSMFLPIFLDESFDGSVSEIRKCQKDLEHNSR